MNSTEYPKSSAISTTSENFIVSLASLFVMFWAVVGVSGLYSSFPQPLLKYIHSWQGKI